MRPKALLIVAAAFVLVVSFYVVFEKVYLPKKEKAKEKEERVFSLVREDLDHIAIDSETTKIILVKENDRWMMTAPFKTETDTGEVESFIASALDAQIGRKLGAKDELKDSLADFGLDKPKLTVTLGSGDETEALLFGNAVASGDEVYAMASGSDQVFLIDGFVMEDINKDTTTLRDKALIAFSPDDIVTLAVTRDSKTVTVKRQADDSWLITEPFEFSADTDEITDILDFISEEGAVGFAPEDAKPADYGLASPAITLLLVDADGATSRLLIGKAAGDGNYWAMREGRPSIFIVTEQVKNKLTVSADFIMNKSLLSYIVSDVTAFELTGPDGTISAVRDGRGWKITKPEEVRGDRNAVNTLLSDLRDMKLSEIVQMPARDLGRYGLDSPTLAISVKVKDGDKERKSTLKLVRDAGETSYGYLLSGSSGSTGDFIFSIPTETIAAVNPTLASLKDRALLSYDQDTVTGITIAAGDKTYDFTRKKDAWKMTKPARKKIDAESMKFLLEAIGGLSYADVLADTKEGLKDWGLDEPKTTITLTGADGEIGTISLGEPKETEDGRYSAAVSSSLKKVYKVNTDLVDAIIYEADIIQEGR
jgi:hypothetical protein